MSFSITGRPQVAPMAVAGPRMARRIRRPQHTAYLHFLPHYLVPFLAHPVLPGETLKNVVFQGRVLSTPLVNQITGWWLETYWFYVKHRHMTNAASYTGMMLDLSTTAAAHTGAVPVFQADNGDAFFVRDAYVAVVNEYFRGDGESIATPTAPALTRLRMPGWWDSLVPENSLDTLLGGVADDTIGGSTALDQVGEVARAIETYNTLRMMGVTNLEYDDWLRSFGVSIAAPQDDRPELIRYTREWTYPANSVSVDATAQRVSSVVSWSLTERIDKDRYFKEPGIILACVLARSKWYHDRQRAGVGSMTNALAWQTPFAGGGMYEAFQPVQGMAGYRFDTRDLFNHGDQWRYAQRGTLNPPTIAWPGDGKFDYPSVGEIDALFVDTTAGFLRMDASANLGIASASIGTDLTPRTV